MTTNNETSMIVVDFVSATALPAETFDIIGNEIAEYLAPVEDTKISAPFQTMVFGINHAPTKEQVEYIGRKIIENFGGTPWMLTTYVDAKIEPELELRYTDVF